MKPIRLDDEDATLGFAAEIARRLHPGLVVYLQGPLGAGKTTFVRGVMRALGYSAAVKSPTYTLLETYELKPLTLWHLDLYRLSDAREMAFLGLDSLDLSHGVMLVEWAERGAGAIPTPDWVLYLDYAGSARVAHWEGMSANGEKLANDLTSAVSAKS